MKARSSPASRLSGMTVLHALYGLGIWAICFIVLYGGLSIGCGTLLAQHSIGPVNGLTALLLALWVVHGGVLVFLVVRALGAVRRARSPGIAPPHDPPRYFMQGLTLFLHTTALVATVAIGLPVLMLAPCV